MHAEHFTGCFSLKLDETPIAAKSLAPLCPTQVPAHTTAVYQLAGGLTICQQLTLYPEYNAVYWRLTLKNSAATPSGLISELNDMDILLPFRHVQAPPPGHMPSGDQVRVLRTIGSNWVRDEFNCREEVLPEGKTLSYSCQGGRSSQGLAPFFDINQRDTGALIAIGWTGQWRAQFQLTSGGVRVITGLEDTHFRLLPGESVLTSSALILLYDQGQMKAHNAFRRLIKAHFSCAGQLGRPLRGPLAHMMWGSVPSEKMIRRIAALSKYGVLPDAFWIDAGWYGYSTGPCPNEFTGDWGIHTGSWTVNKTYHPDALKEVRAAMRRAGTPFVLWVEPERVLRNTDMPTAHPEWFLSLPENPDTLLIDYGNESALKGIFDMLCGLIDALEVDIYRQDFNMDPLPYWRRADADDRRGISEIRHINGLYRLWDMLLKKYPHLLIDNCASGGRRIDIETLSRSVPLWRSDYQCTYDADPETAQVHMNGFNWWIPYSGTGAGELTGDTYRTRSCYGSSMSDAYFYQDHSDPELKKQDMAWLKGIMAEFRRARPYFEADFYPLTRMALDDTAWSIMQFDRPEEKDGMILAFRRPQSPCPAADAPLMALSGTYELEYVDTGKRTTYFFQPGDTLRLSLETPRQSLLIFYKQK